MLQIPAQVLVMLTREHLRIPIFFLSDFRHKINVANMMARLYTLHIHHPTYIIATRLAILPQLDLLGTLGLILLGTPQRPLSP